MTALWRPPLPFSWRLLSTFAPYRLQTLSTCEGRCRTKTQCVLRWCRCRRTRFRASSKSLRDARCRKVNNISELKDARLRRYKWLNLVFSSLLWTRRNKNGAQAWTETFCSAVFLSSSSAGDLFRKVWRFYIYAANYKKKERKKVKLVNWGSNSRQMGTSGPFVWPVSGRSHLSGGFFLGNLLEHFSGWGHSSGGVTS